MTERMDPEVLLQRELDGENSPAESAELQRRIAEDPRLRAGSEKLFSLGRTLAEVGQEDPPPSLVADVMRTIRANGARVRGGWVEVWRTAFARRPAFAYGLSLAAGIVLGALGLGALGPAALGTRDEAAVGTILPPGRLGAFRQVDRQELSSDGFRGVAVTRRGDGTVQAEVRVESNRPLQVTFEFDAKAFSPLGFGRSEAAEGEVVLEPGRVSIAHSGKGTYQVFLGARSAEPAPLTVRIDGQGIQVERSLETGRQE
ncbi:MAG TPA: hypothetical protein VFM88_04340 [Vicinamibacteria bacterium]|nr:hypothetical protein [Vicinamibacteria bacterium]